MIVNNIINIIIIMMIHSFYIVLFSALEQAHRAHVACDSEWVTASLFIARIINIHGSGVLIAVPRETAAGLLYISWEYYTSIIIMRVVLFIHQIIITRVVLFILQPIFVSNIYLI